MANTDEISFGIVGRAGVITLAKPETLNAVTDTMLTAISENLDLWEHDDRVERVIIKAVEGRAFSAGGDIRHLYERGRAGDYDYDFFAREYALNVRIHHYPKPYIALIDGIVMGGGVGVSFHGSHRIAGDNIAFAMPEVGIGFFPDVGGSFLLSRLPGHLGLYLGLTGSRLKQADCVATGLATHACRSADLPDLEIALCEASDVQTAVDGFSATLEDPFYLATMPFVDKAFSGQSVEEVVSRLNTMLEEDEREKVGAGGTDRAQWAAKTLQILSQKSPTSLKIAFEQIRRAKGQSMADCMRMEYRILRRILAGSEFYEGIRAAIIDKDNAPAWSPAQLSGVSQDMVMRHFEPLGPGELILP